MPIPKFALAIDWETTGYSLPDYASSHQGISFGALIVDLRTFEVIESIYHEIKFDSKYTWSSEAEKIHGLSRDYLQNHGVSQEEAAADLANLVIKYIATEAIIVIGHRVNFDIAFTKQLMKSIGIELNFHPIHIDTSSIGTVFLEMDRSEEIFQTMGLPPRGSHNALEDITYTVECVRLMKDFFVKGLMNSM